MTTETRSALAIAHRVIQSLDEIEASDEDKLAAVEVVRQVLMNGSSLTMALEAESSATTSP